MPKVYIAAPFRSLSARDSEPPQKAYGELVDAKYIDFLEAIESVFLEHGFDTCLPHRDEGLWGKVYYEPDAIGALCYRHVATSDFIFAVAEGSRGVHLELGYAAGLGGKEMLLMHQEQHEPSTLLCGLAPNDPWSSDDHSVIHVESYRDPPDLLSRLRRYLSDRGPSEDINIRAAQPQRIAVIDLGSHTLKLKIYSAHPGRAPQLLHAEKESLGVIGGVVEGDAIDAQKIEELVNKLMAWRATADLYRCDAMTAVATAAFRRAANAADVLDRVEEVLGCPSRILASEDEAMSVFGAVSDDFDAEATIAVLNLGGGSIQVVIGQASAADRVATYDFGTRDLIQRWPWDGPMEDRTLEGLRLHVREALAAELYGSSGVDRLIHTGGELDFLLRCRVPMETSLLSPRHPSEVSVDSFARFSDGFRRRDPADIARRFNLDPAWLSGAVASNVIASSLAEILGASAIIPSNLNVTDGLVLANLTAVR